MDDYFTTKKTVEIILENINDHFIKCLVNLSINDRYTNDVKLILGIIELLKTYMETRKNDLLSSCIKYTNKSYYLHLTDSLFRIIQGHLTITKYNNHLSIKYAFITDLIDKYNNPIIANAPKDTKSANATMTISRNFNNNNARTRFNSYVVCDEAAEAAEATADFRDDDDNKDIALLPTKDAGTLFRDAYYKLNRTRNKEFEMQNVEIKSGHSDDLL